MQETLKPGASVSVVARRHDVNANMVFTWRRHHQQGSLVSAARKPRKPKLLPVIVQPDEAELGPRKSDLAQREVLATPAGRIEIEFPGGGRLRADGMVDTDTLRGDPGAVAAMMPTGTRIWLVAGVTDMRKGMDTLCALVQTALADNPFSGQVFIFHGRRGNKVKVLWHEPEGLCLYCKRLDRGHFVWPRVSNGTVLLTSAQLSMLLEGIEWRRPERTAPREIDPKPPTLAA